MKYTPAMKYKLNPHKLAKSPASLIPILFAHFEYDSSYPYFDAIRPYLVPTTPEERWDSLISDVRIRYEEISSNIRRRFQDDSAKANRRFERMKSQFPVIS
jgi:hypothetical protein